MPKFLTLIFVLLCFPLVVLAQPTTPPPTTPPATAQAPAAPSAGVASVQAGIRSTASAGRLQDFCNDRTFGECVANVVGQLIGLLLRLVGIILVGYLIYAGFLWMTSGGDTDKAEEAMKMIRNAVIGMLILVSAFAVSEFVVNSLYTVSQPAPAPAITPSAPATP